MEMICFVSSWYVVQLRIYTFQYLPTKYITRAGFLYVKAYVLSVIIGAVVLEIVCREKMFSSFK